MEEISTIGYVTTFQELEINYVQEKEKKVLHMVWTLINMCSPRNIKVEMHEKYMQWKEAIEKAKVVSIMKKTIVEH